MTIGFLGSLRIDGAAALISALAVTLLLLALVTIRRQSRRRIVATIVAVVAAAAGGFALVWLVGDVLDVFGLSFSWTFRLCIAGVLVGIALAVFGLGRTRPWRRFIAILAIPAVLATSALFVNADFGLYRTVNEALTPHSVPDTTLTPVATTGLDVASADFLASWVPPASMPAAGSVTETAIPATVSRFNARPAAIYLPPAALTATPPRLPVMVMFSGQPGGPEDLFITGHLTQTLDAFAAAHNGLAPIVVVPDQLGSPDQNPMCVDSPLGNVATYITQDVTTWIQATLPVTTDHRYWGVGGFSEGGTCTTQFGAAHPDLYRTWFDIAGEIAPTIGDSTVATAFGGSNAAYEAAKPVAILAANAPYHDVVAIVGYGALDDRYGGETKTVAAAMTAAGVAVTELVSPDSGHDWNTVGYVFTNGIPVLCERLGLATS
ncbi:hypothetical protein HQQ81_08925 [Microbacteriaceae bacterium VKM Ac-2854]|nr:hypothetical protein [Microbacteriaceae bacterium VKM Ac-2854]